VLGAKGSEGIEALQYMALPTLSINQHLEDAYTEAIS